MLFSERHGLKPATKQLQVDDIDDQLRNGLWSVYYEFVLKPLRPTTQFWPADAQLRSLFFTYWFRLYHEPTDTIPPRVEIAIEQVRKRFFAGAYGDVYDFIELTLDNVQNMPYDLQGMFNGVLTRHNSAYRFVEGKALRISSDVEIAAIEDAIDTKLKGVRIHMRAALDKLSDRDNPDYRNAVKEAISAVESLAQSVTGDRKATLGDALKVLAPAIGMHGAFRDALAKLYGYTSDANGIRHALLDEPNVTYADALFMIVTCSGFVNYVIGKATEGKLVLKN